MAKRNQDSSTGGSSPASCFINAPPVAARHSAVTIIRIAGA